MTLLRMLIAACNAATTVFCVLAVSGPASAEPMMAPTPKEAAASDSIVVGEYVGHEHGKGIDYFGGAWAHYKVVKVLKPSMTMKDGAIVGRTIEVDYEFHDGSACLEPPGWKFSESMMPAQSSKWILFLNTADLRGALQVFHTYRGSYGRWAATKENEEKVAKLISHK